MPDIVFYFQVHQPYRIKRYSYFDTSTALGYFDEAKNRQIFEKVAYKCYLPTNAILLDLIKKYQGKFKISYSITGVAIEQMQEYCPDVLRSFQELAASGCVEFLGETYYHSLSAVYNEAEFKKQVILHKKLMQDLFALTPQVFRNTELIYNDHIGHLARSMGFKGVIAEGADDILDWRSPNFVYAVNGSCVDGDCIDNNATRLLLKNYRLSDDVAFRFSNRGWPEFPLTADKFASWVHRVSGNGDIVNLFMDYETFGEHQWETTGIFEFLKYLPDAIFSHSDWGFCTPSEAIAKYPIRAEVPFHRLTSWADVDRDLTAWRGNKMQESALRRIYSMSEAVINTGDEQLIASWRKLTTSDHFYYMCTKWFADGDVHAYFSPYESPYEAFINYMNVLKTLESEPTLQCHDFVSGSDVVVN
jgi:alpha-amylase